MTTGSNDFYYSNRYQDDEFEYRHVHVTKEVAKLIPKNRLMSESEWRSLGIQQIVVQSCGFIPVTRHDFQSAGWIHYMIHSPERHVLLFRRPITTTNTNAMSNANSNAVGVR